MAKQSVRGLLTLSLTIFVLTLYKNTFAPTPAGAAGVGALTLLLFYGLETLVRRRLAPPVTTGQGVCLLAVSAAYLAFACLAPQYAFTVLALDIVSAVMLAVVFGGALLRCGSLKRAVPLLALLFGAAWAAFYFWCMLGRVFTPDSYSYLDIANTLPGDFGRVLSIRQYVVASDYNISFPYFYPLCIWLVDTATGLGIYSGVYLNVFLLLYTAVLLPVLSKRYCGQAGPGAFAAALLLANTNYMDEVVSGRSIPLALALVLPAFALCAEVFLKKKTAAPLFLLMGALAGLAAVTRFDEIVLAAYLALLVALLAKGRRARSLAPYAVGAAVTMAPWCVYSLVHFGRPWMSDNLGTWYYLYTMVPNRVITPDMQFDTLQTAPKEFLYELAWRILRVGQSLVQCSYAADFTLLFCFIVCAAGLWVLHRRGKSIRRYLGVFFAAAVFCGGKTALYMLTGYADNRYHAETVILMCFVLLLLRRRIADESGADRPRGFALLLAAGIVFFSCLSFQYVATETSAVYDTQPLAAVGQTPAWVEKVENELAALGIGKERAILMLDGSGFRYGVLSGRKTYVEPNNLSWQTVSYALEHYIAADLVLAPKAPASEAIAAVTEELRARYPAAELTDYLLFFIQGS